MSFNPKKTEIVIVSNVNVPYVPNFYFNNSQIPLVNNHKHLGVILSNDAKWNCHIKSTLQNVAKYLSTLRKLKYLLSYDRTRTQCSGQLSPKKRKRKKKKKKSGNFKKIKFYN